MNAGFRLVLIVLLFAGVICSASADRLPQEVPENQIFSVSTLLDVTGAVSDSSLMQWTIISGGLEMDGYVYEGDNNINAAGLDNEALLALKRDIAGWIAKYGGEETDYLTTIENTPLFQTGNNINAILYAHLIQSIFVPDDELESIVPFLWNPNRVSGLNGYAGNIVTYRKMLADIGAMQGYRASTSTVYSKIHDTALKVGEEIALLTWNDGIRTNGGKFSLNKNIDFDSRNRGKGLYNLEVEKVLTYNSVEGAHLVGGEEWILDVAGNYEGSADSIRCVFAAASSEWFPAFCNVVKAKSELININSGQISTKGQARAVAATGDIPAALNYQIAVSPDVNAGSGFADGTVKTLFGGAIMEARGNNQAPAATNNWKDEASVTGGIRNFQKVFTYESGFTF